MDDSKDINSPRIIVDNSWGESVSGNVKAVYPSPSKIATSKTITELSSPYEIQSLNHSLPYVPKEFRRSYLSNTERFGNGMIYRSLEDISSFNHDNKNRTIQFANTKPSPSASSTVPSSSTVSFSSSLKQVRPPVNVLATYVNTNDMKVIKTDLLRAHAQFSSQIPKVSISNSSISTSPANQPNSLVSQANLTIEEDKVSLDTDISALNQMHGSRSSISYTRENSGEWGWFADIDSSGESFTTSHRKFSIDRLTNDPTNYMDACGSQIILAQEGTNSRVSAAHKTFVYTEYEDRSNDKAGPNSAGSYCAAISGKSHIVSASISIPKFRIVQSKTGNDRHAQYLITFRLGKDLYADWRRYTEFSSIMKTVEMNLEQFQRTQLAWKNIDTRWFNRLEPSYLHRKCIALENFLRELMYELVDPTLLLDFLGGNESLVIVPSSTTKPNQSPSMIQYSHTNTCSTIDTQDIESSSSSLDTKPLTPLQEYMKNTPVGDAFDKDSELPGAQLPKELRPQQPPQEREFFEKLWAENFKRSCVNYENGENTVKVS